MLLGEMPETVYATGGSYLQEQIPDTTLTTLDFPIDPISKYYMLQK